MEPDLTVVNQSRLSSDVLEVEDIYLFICRNFLLCLIDSTSAVYSDSLFLEILTPQDTQPKPETHPLCVLSLSSYVVLRERN